MRNGSSRVGNVNPFISRKGRRPMNALAKRALAALVVAAALTVPVVAYEVYRTVYWPIQTPAISIMENRCPSGWILSAATPIATHGGYMDLFYTCQYWQNGRPIASQLLVSTFVMTPPGNGTPVPEKTNRTPIDCSRFPTFVPNVTNNGCVPPTHPTAVPSLR